MNLLQARKWVYGKLQAMSNGWVLVCALVIAVCVWTAMAAWGPSLVHSFVNRVAANAPTPEPVAPVVVVVVGAQSASSVPLHAEAVASAVAAAKASQPVAKQEQTTSKPSFADIGQSGDAFGGINALIASVAGALVFWAGFVQARSLTQAKKEADEERRGRLRQQFEATFFQLLELTDTAIERVTRNPNTETKLKERLKRFSAPGPTDADVEKHGAAALDSLAASLKKQYEREVIEYDSKTAARTLVSIYVDVFFAMYPSMLGPYFRLLYQTFKFISDADISAEDKARYASIARGMIGEGAVFLLAANGMSPRGHGFVRLIQEFGLLQHMHSEYKDAAKKPLEAGYRENAFMTSKEREGSLLDTSPKFEQFEFYEPLQSL